MAPKKPVEKIADSFASIVEGDRAERFANAYGPGWMMAIVALVAICILALVLVFALLKLASAANETTTALREIKGALREGYQEAAARDEQNTQAILSAIRTTRDRGT
jgi:Sec-independent protein translocase protein TatA